MLRVEGLLRSVGGFRLKVDHWEVPDGAYHVLVGPSGAGKTMLLETLAGIQREDSGRVWINGRLAGREPPDVRGIGLVYQDCWLFPHMTVRQNIEFARRYHRKGLANNQGRAGQLAEMLGIGHLLERSPRTLSGGERQRVALARALSIRPRLMFLDEPLGMLDPVTREAVATELQACHRRFGMTTVHVTHDHTEARSLGDAVAVMLGGVLEQSGLPEEVFRRPCRPALARFLGCENMFECRAAPADEDGQVKIDLAGRPLTVRSTVLGAAIACIRPEDLLIGPGRQYGSHAMAGNAYPGTVSEVSLRGPLVRMVVEACGLRWVSLMGRSHCESLSCAAGEEVTMILSPDAVHLVPREA